MLSFDSKTQPLGLQSLMLQWFFIKDFYILIFVYQVRVRDRALGPIRGILDEYDNKQGMHHITYLPTFRRVTSHKLFEIKTFYICAKHALFMNWVSSFWHSSALGACESLLHFRQHVLISHMETLVKDALNKEYITPNICILNLSPITFRSFFVFRRNEFRS